MGGLGIRTSNPRKVVTRTVEKIVEKVVEKRVEVPVERIVYQTKLRSVAVERIVKLPSDCRHASPVLIATVIIYLCAIALILAQ